MEQAIPRAESHNNVLPFTLREDARDATQLIIPSLSFEVQEESPFRETPEEQPRKPFIEANTKAVTLGHLQNDCITPVFSKDNEVTISHNQFIETMWECAQRMFRNCTVEEPEIRVSHIVKGRTPEAIHKAVKDLTDEDKTIYYERMMFCIEIPTVTELKQLGIEHTHDEIEGAVVIRNYGEYRRFLFADLPQIHLIALGDAGQ